MGINLKKIQSEIESLDKRINPLTRLEVNLKASSGNHDEFISQIQSALSELRLKRKLLEALLNRGE